MAEGQAGSGRAFVTWLEGAVEVRGGSWRQLAADAGVSASALSALRTGRAERPSMETCFKLAGQLGVEPKHLLELAGYPAEGEAAVDINDPELDLMFHQLMELTPEEREPVKEFVRYALSKAAKRTRRGKGR
jgi:transcriptional regulator with XRE-family HTH domain